VVKASCGISTKIEEERDSKLDQHFDKAMALLLHFVNEGYLFVIGLVYLVFQLGCFHCQPNRVHNYNLINCD
jgi:hypothetical protein